MPKVPATDADVKIAHAALLSFILLLSAVKRFAVVGTGNMAKVRTEAFLASGSACLCGVASGQLKNAQAFAQKFGCPTYTGDYRDLARLGPDMLLVEVPHEVQDEVVLWSLGSGFHTLVGGCLATRAETAEQIVRMSHDKSLVVEAGYEARYKRVWELTKQTVAEGLIGAVVAVRSLALYPASPDSWYYSEQKSGGMVLTHMSYAFLNPLRWIFGNPRTVSAFANQKQQRGADKVKHELCSANFIFANDVICNMTAGFVKPKNLDAWHVSFIGTRGSLELRPRRSGRGVTHRLP